MADARSISGHVAAKDLPRAAFAAKQLLDRGAHVQVATGVLLGLAKAEVQDRRAAAVCTCFVDLLTGDPAERRTNAARLLVTAMRAIGASATGAGDATPGEAAAVVVNAASIDMAIAQPSPARAAAFARAMSRTRAPHEVAAALSDACGRVCRLHGTSRNPDGLEAFARCPLFAKPGKSVQEAAGALLLAAVRSAYVMAPEPPQSTPELEAALHGAPAAKGGARDRDPVGEVAAAEAGSRGEPELSTEDKLSVLWTFVNQSAARGHVEAAVEEAATAAEYRTIEGRGHLPKARDLARVRLLP